MAAAFHEQFATMVGQMAYQLAALHERIGLDVDGDLFALCACGMLACGERAIGFQDELDGFLQIAAHLCERASLCIHTWDFFHGADLPAPSLLDHGCEFALHGGLVRLV
jgi:hypothetical protein